MKMTSDQGLHYFYSNKRKDSLVKKKNKRMFANTS